MRNAPIEMTGQLIGPWTVLELAERPTEWKNTPGAYWLCRCACGETEVIQGARLRAGRYNRGCRLCRGLDHPKRGSCSPTYNSWRAMRGRCLRPDDTHYYLYGGRGITICDAWINNFPQFLRDMGERPVGKSLDRINSDGPYSPENCRWADAKTQSRNSSHFRLSDEQVIAIRRLLALGATQQDIAVIAGVARSHIANIATGHSRASPDTAMKAALAESGQ